MNRCASTEVCPAQKASEDLWLFVAQNVYILRASATRKLHPAARALAHSPDRKTIAGDNSPSIKRRLASYPGIFKKCRWVRPASVALGLLTGNVNPP